MRSRRTGNIPHAVAAFMAIRTSCALADFLLVGLDVVRLFARTSLPLAGSGACSYEQYPAVAWQPKELPTLSQRSGKDEVTPSSTTRPRPKRTTSQAGRPQRSR
jgi:hypothetical protein